MNWFGKRNPPPETTPGGSTVYRYPAADFAPPQIGALDEAAEFTEAREAVYRKLFGEADSVSHELVPQVPHIDVYTAHRQSQDGSRTCVLATGGMSDLPMRAPRGAEALRRVELILYCREPKPEYIDTLRWLAHFPHSQKTWIGFGHTIPNGNPPAPMWGSSVLDTVLLMPTIVNRDQALPDQLQLAGEPVNFLWVVPISTAECSLKLEKGMDAIYELFDRHRHPHVFNAGRASYV